jgi:hypothetical protein
VWTCRQTPTLLPSSGLKMKTADLCNAGTYLKPTQHYNPKADNDIFTTARNLNVMS